MVTRTDDVIFRTVTEADGPGVRSCYHRAHQVMYYQSAVVAFQDLIRQWWVPGVLFSVFAATAALTVRRGNGSYGLALAYGILSVGTLVGVTMLACYGLSRTLWKILLDKTVEERDISPGRFEAMYCGTHNVSVVGVAQSTGEVVGCAAVLTGPSVNAAKPPHFPNLNDDGSVGLLCRVGVVPERQGQGIGKRITVFTLQLAQSRGVKKMVLITLSPQKPAIRMYRSMGFNEVAREPLMSLLGLYGVIMEKTLVAE